MVRHSSLIGTYCIFAVRCRFDSHLSYSLLSTEFFFQKLSHFRSYGVEKAILWNEAHFLFEERRRCFLPVEILDVGT